ncbi:MAG: metallopeptidase [Nitrososphaerota archaeon]|jgi:predicted metallopeptidase|nr:metallopeptidase [Nitrososphaerota archaeon]
MISYEKASDVEVIAHRLIDTLALSHIDKTRLYFYRSTGSRSRRVQARIHGMGRIWFDALAIQPRYIVEVISEEYDKLAVAERERVIIHELMHIPSKFSGGFVPHKGKITKRSVERLYQNYLAKSSFLSKE